ncbi:hypothetical protein GIB67_018368 [Kingdonia uniflora]|uniref:Uncharacterized protein n=1 Tax=Kingdonia uniflora TaxID=39325 RepID=A0A7J7MJ92_9MAGN|nr:hypothetical protein GIB67_018368 [Kingdonia uniflora]
MHFDVSCLIASVLRLLRLVELFSLMEFSEIKNLVGIQEKIGMLNFKWVEVFETSKCRDKWAKFKRKGLNGIKQNYNATRVDHLGGMNCINIDEYDNANAERSVHDVADPVLVQNLDEDDVSTNVSTLLGKRGLQYDKEN